MTNKTSDSSEALQDEIRRQFNSSQMTRFLRSMPAFRLDNDMPESIRDMLAQLDRVENQSRNRYAAD